MNYEGEKFLLKLYRELYNEEEVRHSGTKSDDKFKLINKYMKRLEKSEKVFDGDHSGLEKYMRERYYDRYVIKEEDIPDSYYELQKRIALERGYGHVEYTPDMKHQEAMHIIEEQKKSLDKWLDYLMKENTAYPMWARYWAFQGMLKLGMYNKEKNAFTRRSKGTTAPFVEINPEALSYAIETVVLYQNGKEIDDEELKKLVASGNFGKIYSHNLWKIANDAENKDKTNSLAGIWVHYEEGDAPEVARVLSGKGTGWCIAGESMAESYLSVGTFDIYFTKDSQGEYTNPRACIRTENGKIAEVRGIKKNQNMEPEMTGAVDEKLDEFPDKEKYKKKVRDMNKLTEIYNKAMANIDLNREDLFFLFEVDNDIEGFGWRRDPRIDEIKEKIIVKDKDIAITVLNETYDIYNSLTENLKEDPDIISAFRNLDAADYRNFPFDIRANKEVTLSMAQKSGNILLFASTELRDDKEVVLAAVTQNGQALRYASDRLRNDKEIVLEAVKQDGLALEYASEKLKNDKEIVLEAVRQDNYALFHASRQLKDDKEVVLEAVKRNGRALKYASLELQKDRELVLEAVGQNANNLEFASKELQDDKELVLSCVKQKGEALEYASSRLKDDKEVVLAAVRKKGEALKYASKRLRNNYAVVLEAIKQDGDYLCYAGDQLKDNKEMVLEAIKQNAHALAYAFKRLKDDKDVVLASVRQNGANLEYAGPKAKNNKEIVLEAVKQNGLVLLYASSRLKNDCDVVLEAIKQNKEVIGNISEELWDNKEIVLEAVRYSGTYLEKASERLQDDKDVVLEAVKTDGLALFYASDRLRNDKDVALEAVKQNATSLIGVSKELQSNNDFINALANAINKSNKKIV